MSTRHLAAYLTEEVTELSVSTYEGVSCAEDVQSSVSSPEVSIFDTITGVEDITCEVESAVADCDVDVYSELSITEDAVIYTDSNVSVVDTATLTEVVAGEWHLVGEVYDEVTIAEVPGVLVIQLVLPEVVDTILVSEDSVAEVSVLNADAIDTIEITDAISTEVSASPVLYVTVDSAVTINEDFEVEVSAFIVSIVSDVEVTLVSSVEISTAECSVVDSIVATESAEVSSEDLTASVYEEISTAEDVNSRIHLYLSIYDEIELAEVVSGLSSVLISVSDETGVVENIECLVWYDTLYIETFDATAVTDTRAGVVGAVILSTYDAVSISELAKPYWLIVHGRIEIFAEAEAISVSARGVALSCEAIPLQLGIEARGM